ncbi:MAG: tRNA ((1)-)-methyltransferase, tRNA (guanine37-N1)-methyltransferase [Candidatus Parcubacteria bacterium]|jgi:tRNA (guanine37-N1)-methyltransferase
MFDSYLGESILARGIKEKKIRVSFYDPRQYVTGKHKKVWPDGNVSRIVDDRPYGGGPGMILRAEPVLKATEAVIKKISKNSKGKIKIVYFSPSGKKFDTAGAKNLAKKYTDIIMISGRYEGIDARVAAILKKEIGTANFADISIGDYVLTGGELPAMVLIDSISRQIEGVLGKFESLEEERISASEFYTRPEILEWKGKKHKVPKVLLGGNHKEIEEWKRSKTEPKQKKTVK